MLVSGSAGRIIFLCVGADIIRPYNADSKIYVRRGRYHPPVQVSEKTKWAHGMRPYDADKNL